MLPTLLGQRQTNQHAFLYWEFHERGFQQAARMGDWKAVRPQADEKLELYNLKTDIGEKENVAEKNPEIVAKMEAYLKTARTESEDFPIKKAAQKKEKKRPLRSRIENSKPQTSNLARAHDFGAGASLTHLKPVCESPVSGVLFIRALGR
jgi:hypothetical protein